MQENWVRKAAGDVRVAATTQGYITKAKFHEHGLRFAHYFRQQELNDRPHMLIVDSHSSHLYNLPFYQVMKANNIHVFTILPHTSHILQPLDSTPSGMFKRNWEINLMKYNSAPWKKPEQGGLLGCFYLKFQFCYDKKEHTVWFEEDGHISLWS